MTNFKFETLALHAGHTVDSDTLSRGVPIYRTSAYLFRDTEHAANLFGSVVNRRPEEMPSRLHFYASKPL